MCRVINETMKILESYSPLLPGREPVPCRAVVWVIALALACSSPGTPDEVQGERADAPALQGKVLHDSDIQLTPDSPYSSGHVVLIREADWQPLRDSLSKGSPPPGDGSRPGLVGRLLAEPEFSQFVNVHQTLSEEGDFTFDPPPGHYRLCVGHLGDERPVPPLLIFGCHEIFIREGISSYWRITFGEAGLRFHSQ